jgi:uncharacterized protein (DUF1697 family)
MATYVALLRAVNVGGTGKLPMADLRAMCTEAGFERVRTYIASGNVVLESDGSEAEVKGALETRLHAYAGKPVRVLVRTADEMRALAAANPFPDAAPNRTVVILLDEPPPPDALEAATGVQGEEMALGVRAVYVHYDAGMADSRLRIPAVVDGTGRNLNTIRKLAEMAAEATG